MTVHAEQLCKAVCIEAGQVFLTWALHRCHERLKCRGIALSFGRQQALILSSGRLHKQHRPASAPQLGSTGQQPVTPVDGQRTEQEGLELDLSKKTWFRLCKQGKWKQAQAQKAHMHAARGGADKRRSGVHDIGWHIGPGR